jgi:hypothetical protein
MPVTNRPEQHFDMSLEFAPPRRHCVPPSNVHTVPLIAQQPLNAFSSALKHQLSTQTSATGSHACAFEVMLQSLPYAQRPPMPGVLGWHRLPVQLPLQQSLPNSHQVPSGSQHCVVVPPFRPGQHGFADVGVLSTGVQPATAGFKQLPSAPPSRKQ